MIWKLSRSPCESAENAPKPSEMRLTPRMPPSSFLNLSTECMNKRRKSGSVWGAASVGVRSGPGHLEHWGFDCAALRSTIQIIIMRVMWGLYESCGQNCLHKAQYPLTRTLYNPLTRSLDRGSYEDCYSHRHLNQALYSILSEKSNFNLSTSLGFWAQDSGSVCQGPAA